MCARPISLGGVVTIEGMPSVGKTTLAIKVAHELAEHFPDDGTARIDELPDLPIIL